MVVPTLTALVPLRWIDGIAETIFEPDAVPGGYTDHIGGTLSLRRESQRANAQQIWTLRPHIVEMSQHYASSLKMPVEIVHGTADEIVPASIHSDPLASVLENARYTRLEGVGHMPHHADPQAVVDAIDRAARRAGLR